MTRRYFCHFDEGEITLNNTNYKLVYKLRLCDFSFHCILFRNDKDVIKMTKVKRIRELIRFQLKGGAIKNTISKIVYPIAKVYVLSIFTNRNYHW